MKIVSQLLNTTPNATTKASPSQDSGADFQGALTMATARSTGSTGKAQGSEKQQTAENKKKSAVSDSSLSNTAAPPVVTSKLPPENQAVQAAIVQTVNGDASGQASKEPSSFARVVAGSGSMAGAHSSLLASISSAIQLPANGMFANASVREAVDGKTVSSTKPSDLTASDAKQQSNSGSTVSQLDHSTASPIPDAATLSVVSATEKSAPADQATGESKAADTSNLAPTANLGPTENLVPTTNSIDPTPLTAQAAVVIPQSAVPVPASEPRQASTVAPSVGVPVAITSPGRASDPQQTKAVAQSIAASVSLPGPSTVNERQASTVVEKGTPVPFSPSSLGKASDPQLPVAVVQSVDLPVSLPTLSSAIAPQMPVAFTTGQSPIFNTAASNTKEAASRSIPPASKAKPTAPASDARTRAADDKGGETQTVSSPAAGTFVEKTSGTSGVVNHAATEPHGAIDAAALQQIPQSTSIDGPTHTTQNQQGPIASGEATMQAAPGQLPSDSQAMQGISSAQLTQSMRSSEMKLGMQSAEFGNISISTSLNHQAISAQISIDHSELGKALAVHLPAIEEKLGSAYGVQAKVELRESNNPSSSNNSGYSNSGQQSREHRQSRESEYTTSQGAMFEHVAARANFAVSSAVETTTRLDIRI